MKTMFLAASLLMVLSGCATGPGQYDKVGFNPQAAELNIRLGLNYLQQKKYDLANDKLGRALQQAPSSAQANWAYALLQEDLDKPAEADRYYRKAMDLDGNASDILNGYGAFLCKQGKAAQAYSLFEKAAANKLYQTPEYALTNAGICAMREDNLVAAKSYLDRALQANGNYASALYQMAVVAFREGRYFDSRGFRQRLEAIVNRPDPKVLGLCVKTEGRLDNQDDAADCARRLKAEFPSSEEAKAIF